MIKVTIFYQKKNSVSGFKIEGHSGYSEKGSDIVCSAVTTVAMTVVNGLTDVVGIRTKAKVCDGFLECIFPKKLSAEQEYGAKVLTDSMYLTLKNIEQQYKDYIVIIERRCSK
ncbi:MAG: ribosomal-processing cysteine protease Prp [Ruminococcaceae bacterium]|nr:ribosomal-processing cysteine protease Prp [Oscillospiraceae bacterium]